MAHGTSKAIYPTVVMLIIVVWYPRFKEVSCSVHGSECDSQISMFT